MTPLYKVTERSSGRIVLDRAEPWQIAVLHLQENEDGYTFSKEDDRPICLMVNNSRENNTYYQNPLMLDGGASQARFNLLEEYFHKINYTGVLTDSFIIELIHQVQTDPL